ncbi:hypothetical protein C1J03_16325 [Sulfitobacter sp. SK012]|uniref:ATP-binding protein n=1 Tax=Sulfitobacter sp. SK012 TaxID=1389005 RepID=UPI000E0C4822|nr:ATP-binding protein [Sulfitobacter sp. SK012]AXI47436.1 hypothetical protein C1J03_16325 [Sulfitobacter sp. SK012]
MFLAAKIRILMKQHQKTKFILWTKNSQFTGWADHIGLFRFLGFKRGNETGAARGSTNYTPITVYDIAELRDAAGDIPVGKHVAKTIQGLAENLSQQDKGPVFDLVEYSLREIVRNAAEHSRGTKIALLGQCWPAKKMAEIIVMDNGVGIAENLYENELLECETNREALKFAILPGVTGVSLDDRLQQDDHWKNSGFGMFVTSRFCAENGLFRVVSGADGLSLGGEVQTEHPWSFKGTFVQMRLSFGDAQRRLDRIDELTDSGKIAFGELLKDHPIRASTASKLLASQFLKTPN